MRAVDKIENCNPSSRSGMTLVELLVVIGIILLAAVMFVPRLKPAMDKSRIREAARVIQLLLSSARNQAMATGRSVGVMIEPLPSETGCAMTLSQVETPVPYGGDTIGSTATVSFAGFSYPASGGTLAKCNIALSSATSLMLNAGDLIQVGYQGFSMLLNNSAAAGASNLTASLDISHGETPAWLYQPVTGPYKIWRWPTKTAAAKLQLPAPTVIDLTCSGNDPTGATGSATWPIQTPLPTPPTLPTPVIVMFASDGRIDWISNSANPAGQQVTTPVYLLVGLRNKVFDSANDPNMNLNDFQSLWVSIDAATGLIVVADMAAVGTSTAVLTPSNNPAAPDSRYFARQASANGGGK